MKLDFNGHIDTSKGYRIGVYITTFTLFGN